jgi:transglutaminase-like putative cysteine protease
MRIVISHDTRYRYALPASGIIQTLRLTPRNHNGQYVVSWRIHISADCPLIGQEDAFGNLTHTFSTDSPVDELVVRVEGEVDTDDTQGIVRGAIERFPASLFLRETPLTQADDSIAQFATQSVNGAGKDELTRMHALLSSLNRIIVFDTDPTHAATTAAEAFALKRGVCQDITHIFIAAARSLGIPARYVSGYFHRIDGVVEQDAGHAWAEAYIPDLGWVGFDATNGISTTEAHLRVAVGLDYLSAAPVRGTRFGGAGENLDVRISVNQAMRLSQD